MRAPLDVRHAGGQGGARVPEFDVSTPAGALRRATPAEVTAAEYGREAYCDGYAVAQVREGAKASGHDIRFAVAGFLAAEVWADHVFNDPFPVEAGCAEIDSAEFAKVVAWWDRVATRVPALRDLICARMVEVLGWHEGIFANAEGEA